MGSNMFRLRRSFAFVGVIWLAWCFGESEGIKCAANAVAVECGGFKGIVYSVNNSLPPIRVSNLASWSPIDVPDKSILSISICNYANDRVKNRTLFNDTVVPTLVGSVGRYASVRVNVYNSANFHVEQRLVVGEAVVITNQTVANSTATNSTAITPPPTNDTSVISKVVRGPVKDGASIFVNVSKSANIKLGTGAKELRIGRGTLINEVINGGHESAMHCFMDVCFDAVVFDSANVQAELRGGPDLFIQDGQLDDETIDTGCLGKGSTARVRKYNVSNVNGVRNLTIVDGELSDEAVDVLHLFGANADVQVANVGNVQAKFVNISEGELIDELVDARDVADSQISVLGVNSANIRADDVYIFEGELIDESVDVRYFNRSSVVITLANIGNVHANRRTSITHGELVDEVFDVLSIRHGLVDISLMDVANIQCGSGIVNLTNAELLESVIDVTNVTQLNASVVVKNSANIRVPNNRIFMTNATFAAKTIDVDNLNTKHSALRVKVRSSSGNNCARCGGRRCGIRGKSKY